MRKIIGAAFVSLDGVMQAPGGPTERGAGLEAEGARHGRGRTGTRGRGPRKSTSRGDRFLGPDRLEDAPPARFGCERAERGYHLST